MGGLRVARIQYVGATAVHCREFGRWSGLGDVVEPGDVLDVPDSFAERAIASGPWRSAGNISSTRRAPRRKKDDDDGTPGEVVADDNKPADPAEGESL